MTGLALLQAASSLAQAPEGPTLTLPEVDPELAVNIRAHLQILQQGCDVSLVRVRRLLPQARDDMRAALESLGYYHGDYTLQARAAENCWHLDATLTPGPRILLDQVNIQVAGDADTQRLFSEPLAEAGLASGAPLHHGRYEDLKSALSGRAADEGFFDARFDRSEVAVDLVDNSADVDLVLNPGTRFRFGDISLSGQGVLREALVRDMMGIEAGDPYSSASLAELRANLDVSQYFREIRVTPEIGSSIDQSIPVSVEVALRPRHAWTAGLGFSTDTGPRATLGYENRFVNSRGHKLKADTTFSTLRSVIDGSYIIPLPGDVSRKLVLSSGYNDEDNDSYQSKRLQAAATVTNETSGGWQQSAFLELLREDYVVGSDEEVTVLLMPGISLSRTSADDVINPSRGWKVYGSTRVASDTFLSDTTFAQVYGSTKFIHSLGPARLLARLEGASTWIDNVSDLPASLRYFTGGDQSVRGYDFRELGPLNADGTEVVGGRHLLVGSVEMDFRVRDNWRVAVFTDAGNAFNTTNDLEFKRSVGFGVRWMSPLGPVRIDLAHPIDGEDAVRLHVTMGPDL